MKAFISGVMLLAGITAAIADDLYVATTGSDTNNSCRAQAMPCLTGQHAVDQIPFATVSTIHFADGIYNGQINIFYWRFVVLEGNCANPQSVSLRPTANNQAIVWGQDGAIAHVQCFELNGNGFSGITALAGRQWSIIDFGWLYFAGLSGGIGASVNTSTASCVNPIYIDSSMSIFASASNNGYLNMPCLVTLLNSPVFSSVFVSVGLQSTLSFAGAKFGGTATGTRWSVLNGTLLTGGNTLPGTAEGSVYGSGTVW
jgi:hypothetical protein